jgi:hypothetical protein
VESGPSERFGVDDDGVIVDAVQTDGMVGDDGIEFVTSRSASSPFVVVPAAPDDPVGREFVDRDHSEGVEDLREALGVVALDHAGAAPQSPEVAVSIGESGEETAPLGIDDRPLVVAGAGFVADGGDATRLDQEGVGRATRGVEIDARVSNEHGSAR